MANAQTLNFGLDLLYPNQAQKDVVVNQDLTQIDSLLQLNAIDLGTNTPPGAPSDQDKHIVGLSPTGAWAGKANNLAIWQANGSFWQFYVPQTGWVVFSVAASSLYAWVAGVWTLIAPTIGPGTTLGQIAALAPNLNTIIVGNGTAWTEETGQQFVTNNAAAIGAAASPYALMYALIFGG